MRFWLRSLLIVVATIAAFFAIMRAERTPFGVPTIAWLFALVVVANGALYAFLRCPNCGKWACMNPSGRAFVLVGMRCRYCDVEY